MKIIDKQKIRLFCNKMYNEISIASKKLYSRDITPKFTIISVDSDIASQKYVSSKLSSAKKCNIIAEHINLPKNVKEEEILSLIDKLNHDIGVHSIIVQLPLPENLDRIKIINRIDLKKDIDGFSFYWQGRLLFPSNEEEFCLIPPTAQGVLFLLKAMQGSLVSKNVLVVGASNIAGLPIAMLLLKERATVTIAHNKTTDLKKKCLAADIVISAVGKVGLITKDMLTSNTIVIDVGINRMPSNNKSKDIIVGDVDFVNCRDVTPYITPVPGGVGLLTVAFLLRNVLLSACRNLKSEEYTQSLSEKNLLNMF